MVHGEQNCQSNSVLFSDSSVTDNRDRHKTLFDEVHFLYIISETLNKFAFCLKTVEMQLYLYFEIYFYKPLKCIYKIVK